MAFTLGPKELQCAALTFSAVTKGLMNINEQVSNVIQYCGLKRTSFLESTDEIQQ